MKNYLKLSLMLCASAFIAAGSANAQQLKIATVDIQSLFKDYHRTDTEQKVIAEEFARINKENTERQKTIREIEEQLQKLKKKIEDPTLSDNVRREKLEERNTKINEGKAMEQERRDFISRRSRALEIKKQGSIQGIMQEIRDLVVEHSKNEDFDYVLDKSGATANGVPFLLYTKDSTDITAEILTVLNKDAPAPVKEAAAE